MARLRLFANLREMAGAGEIDIAGATVGEILGEASQRFGQDFGRALESSQVWVDGQQAEESTPVAAGSEVAVIPPVSGGAMAVRSPILIEIGIAAFLTTLLFVANALSLEWLAVAVVLVGALWVYDLAAAADRRGLAVGTAPGLLGCLAAVLATYRFGAPGMAAATVGATLLVLVWGVLNRFLRSIESIAGGVALATTASFGTGSLILLGLRTEAREDALAFLFVAAVAIGISWLSDRSDMPVLDPLVAMIVAAITAGAIAGAVWAPDLLNTVAASVAAALALVAGRNLGTLLRAGGFFVSGTIPGSLHYLDGLFMAAGPFWVILTVLG